MEITVLTVIFQVHKGYEVYIVILQRTAQVQ